MLTRFRKATVVPRRLIPRVRPNDLLAATTCRYRQVSGRSDRSRAGQGMRDCFQSVVRIGYRNHAVPAGFKQKRSDGENLFIVVDAENNFLRAHFVSVLSGLVRFFQTQPAGSVAACANTQTATGSLHL